MAGEERLSIAIEAVNNASSTLNQIKSDLQALGNAALTFGDSLQGIGGIVRNVESVLETLGSGLKELKSGFQNVESGASSTVGEFQTLGNAVNDTQGDFQALGSQLKNVTVSLSTFDSISSASDEGLKSLGSASDKASSDLKELGSASDKAKNDIKELGNEAQNSGKKIESFGDRLSSAGGKLVGVGAGLSAGLTLPLQKLGTEMVEQVGNIEQLRVAFDTMLGSAEAGAKTLNELQQFAAKTPFDLPTVATGGKQLLAFGVTAQELIPTLKSLGDASAGTGADFTRLISNFGQVKTQGKLTGRELKDFQVNGIPILDELAKNLGKTTTQVQDMVSEGKIGFKEVEKAFATMSGEGGRFFNLMEKQSKTFQGVVSNLGDNFIRLSLELLGVSTEAEHFGDIIKGGAFDILKTAAEGLLTSFTTLVEAFKKMDTGTKNTIIGVGLFIAALGPLALLAGTLTLAFGALSGPIGLILLAFTGAGIAAILFRERLGELADAFEPIRKAAATVFDTIGQAIGQIDFNKVLDGVIAFANGFISAIATVGGFFATIFGGIIKVLLDLNATFGNVFGQIAKFVSENIETIGRIGGVVLGVVVALKTLVTAFSLVQTAITAVGAAVGLLTSPFTIAVAVIAAAVYAYTTNLGGFRDFVDIAVIEIGAHVKQLGLFFHSVGDVIKIALDGIAYGIIFVGTKILEVLGNLPGAAGAHFRELAQSGRDELAKLEVDMKAHTDNIAKNTEESFRIAKEAAEDKLAIMTESVARETGAAKDRAQENLSEQVAVAQQLYGELAVGTRDQLALIRENNFQTWDEAKVHLENTLAQMKDNANNATGETKDLLLTQYDQISKGVVEKYGEMNLGTTAELAAIRGNAVKETAALRQGVLTETQQTQLGVAKNTIKMREDALNQFQSMRTGSLTQAQLMKAGVTTEASTTASNVSTKLSGIGNNATAWGEHLASNFAKGISNKIGSVSNAVGGILDAVKAIKFSTNPLLPTEDWGEHAVENFAGGMEVAQGEVVDQVDNIKDTLGTLADVKISLGDLSQFEDEARKEIKNPKASLNKQEKKEQADLNRLQAAQKKNIDEVSEALESLGVFVVKQNGKVVDTYKSIEDGIKKYKDRLIDLNKQHVSVQDNITKIGVSIQESLNPNATPGEKVIKTYDDLKEKIKEIEKAVQDANKAFEKFTDDITKDAEKSAEKIESINDKYNKLITDVVQKTSASVASAYSKELENQKGQVDKLASAVEKQSDSEYKLKQAQDSLLETQTELLNTQNQLEATKNAASNASSYEEQQKQLQNIVELEKKIDDMQKKVLDTTHKVSEAEKDVASAKGNVTSIQDNQKATDDAIKQFNELRVNAKDFSLDIKKASEESKKLTDELAKLKADKAGTDEILAAQQKLNAAKQAELILLGKQQLTIQGRAEFEDKLAEEEAKRNLSDIDFLLFKAGKEIQLNEEKRARELKLEEDLQKVRKQLLDKQFQDSIKVGTDSGQIDFTQANEFLAKLKESGASQEAVDLAQRGIQELANKKSTLEAQKLLLEQAKVDEVKIYTDTRIELENQQHFLEDTLTQSYDNMILKLKELELAAKAALAAAKAAGAGGSSGVVNITPGLPGHAEGGYTAPGGKNEVAGIVHKGEWVAPKWMVGKFGNLFSMLEGVRNNKYADGGLVKGTTYNQPITMNNQISDQADMNQMAEFLAWKLRTS